MAPDLTGQVVKAEAHYFTVGGSADIWRGMMMSTNKDCSERRVVAVKVLRGPVDQNTFQKIVPEIRVWDVVQHPNITPFLGVSLDFDGPQTPCLVSPYYRNGDIMTYLKAHQNVEILPLITQIAAALAYLHGRSIIHGNVKGSNILINDDCEALLTDFRRSRITGEPALATVPETTTSELVPELAPLSFAEEGFDLTTEAWRWMARELMSVEEDSIPLITPATDVWAFSMTVIEIFSQRIPLFHIKVDASAILFIVSGGQPKREYYGQINDDIWHVLQQCWNTDPNQRPSMATLFGFFGTRMTYLNAERAHL